MTGCGVSCRLSDPWEGRFRGGAGATGRAVLIRVPTAAPGEAVDLTCTE